MFVDFGNEAAVLEHQIYCANIQISEYGPMAIPVIVTASGQEEYHDYCRMKARDTFMAERVHIVLGKTTINGPMVCLIFNISFVDGFCGSKSGFHASCVEVKTKQFGRKVLDIVEVLSGAVSP